MRELPTSGRSGGPLTPCSWLGSLLACNLAAGQWLLQQTSACFRRTLQGGVLEALLVSDLHQGHYAEARGLVPQTQHLMRRMSANRKVSQTAIVARGPGCIVRDIFLSADPPK